MKKNIFCYFMLGIFLLSGCSLKQGQKSTGKFIKNYTQSQKDYVDDEVKRVKDLQDYSRAQQQAQYD